MRKKANRPTDLDMRVLRVAEKMIRTTPPTRQELSAQGGFPLGTVQACLERLRSHGLVDWEEGRHRSLALTEQGRQLLQEAA